MRNPIPIDNPPFQLYGSHMTSKAKRLRRVYLKAADLIISHNEKFSCCAISNAVSERDNCTYNVFCLERVKYAEIFAPVVGCDGVWFTTHERPQEQCREDRILALLLMAEIAKDL